MRRPPPPAAPRARLRAALRATLSASLSAALCASLCACTPPAAPPSAAWPEEVVAYGGADDLSAWLYAVQAYAQDAYPGAPAFAPLAPGMLAGAFGVQTPQALDLAAPVRWVVAAPAEGAAPPAPPADPSKDVYTPSGELLYKAPAPPPPRAPWRALAALRLTPLAVEGGALSANVLSPTLWRAAEGREGVYEPLTSQFDGKLYVRGRWLILSNDEGLYARAADALIAAAERPLSPHLSARVLLRQLKAHRAALDARSGGLLRLSDPSLDEVFNGDELSLTLSVTAARLAVEVGAPLRGGLAALAAPRLFSPAEALGALQGNATGFVAGSLNGLNLKELAARVPELPRALATLAPAPDLTLALALNSALELNGVLSGPEASRAPWLRAVLSAVQVTLAEAKAKEPSAVSLRVEEAEEIDGLRVERLALGDLPPPSATGPRLVDWRAQVREAELLHAPTATLMSFGPRSHARLAAWREGSRGEAGGLLAREDVKGLTGRCGRMGFALYLSPLVVERLAGATPTAEELGGEEGLAALVCARPRAEGGESLVGELSVPVGVARRAVGVFLRGGFPLK